MFRKVLIANRGEIAVRVIRACHDLGIQTAAVYSEADADSLHVRLADEKVCIGPPPTKDSYLNISNIISAALITECDAIHPGVGMLAENAHFAEACQQCDIKFIGPRAPVIEALGNKARARQIMAKAGIPVIPGSDGVVESQQSALRLAQEKGYPVIIKAAAGGGGRGIRVVHNEGAMDEAIRVAQGEAKAAFGDASVYLEKYLDEPRHVEFQVLADEHGNTVNLGERDCSLQYRWHQKILEESPSPALSPSLRRHMGEAAVRAAKAANYQNCGTVEFLVDKDDHFYFMEMNTRLQVEHPVTEAVTGLDLVAEQIRVAQGAKLSFQQRDVHNEGWAIECRIDARDPENNLLPCSGTVTELVLPGGPGVRVDTHLYAHYQVSNHYDPLLAKVIVHAGDREAAIRRMERALSELRVEGVCTTRSLHETILQNAFFRQGKIHTNFLRRRMGL